MNGLTLKHFKTDFSLDPVLATLAKSALSAELKLQPCLYSGFEEWAGASNQCSLAPISHHKGHLLSLETMLGLYIPQNGLAASCPIWCLFWAGEIPNFLWFLPKSTLPSLPFFPTPPTHPQPRSPLFVSLSKTRCLSVPPDLVPRRVGFL